MRQTVEREVKLVPPDDFRLADLGGTELPGRDFVSTYFDTPDLRLAHGSITLRHRAEDGVGLWQLKVPHGAARIELEVPGLPARPPAELLRLLPAHLRGEEPARVARLRTRRKTLRVDGAEIVEDAVSVLDGQHVAARFRELEVELYGGDEETLRRLQAELEQAGAKPFDLRPKVFRALDLPAPSEASSPPGPEAPPVERLRAALVEQGRRLLAHDPGTRLGADPEELHQMRVATRRARAFLRAARPLLDRAWAEDLRAELGWLGNALGPARDLDVLVERVRGDVAREGTPEQRQLAALVASLEHEREEARTAVLDALGEDRYFTLLDRLEAVEPRPAEDAADVTLAGLWWKEFERTRRAFKRLGSHPSDDELHAARIRAKRARYAAELAGAELGREGERFVDAAKDLQDVLGEHQDSAVAEARIVAWTQGHPDAEAAALGLVHKERARRKKARAAWPDVWSRLKRRGRKARP